MEEKTEKRMAENYEITHSLRIGDREVVLGVDEKSEQPYFCAFYRKQTVLCYIKEWYEECVVDSDYVRIMEVFAERVQEQCAKVRKEWAQITVPREPVTSDMCYPHDYGQKLVGKVVAIKTTSLLPEYRTADHQLVWISGGSGAYPNSRGTSCFSVNLYTGENVRWSRFDVLGEVKPECLPEWAKQRLEVISQSEQQINESSKEAR